MNEPLSVTVGDELLVATVVAIGELLVATVVVELLVVLVATVECVVTVECELLVNNDMPVDEVNVSKMSIYFMIWFHVGGRLDYGK